jgi:catechol 2,3-dioxygenase
MIKIPDNTKIQSIDLIVKNLDETLNFYNNLIGFNIVELNDKNAYLSANGRKPYLIGLHENPQAKYPAKESTGLFHIAVKFPNRKELAKVFLRLFENKVKFQGFSDHIVSEAVYLADPDGSGIELYTDKPDDTWNWRLGQVEMNTLPLNLQVLTNALSDDDLKSDTIHPETEIGHIHLKVSDLLKAEKFYSRLLGFRITNSAFSGALFLSAGKYHHRIGVNVWSTKNSIPPPENTLGLMNFTINIPDENYLNSITEMTKTAGIESGKSSDGKIILRDFDNNKIILTL